MHHPLSRYWWLDVWQRAWRTALQVALPIVAGIQASAGDIDLGATALALAATVSGSLVWSVLRAILGITAGDWISRALVSAVATLVGFLPPDLLSWTQVNWRAATAASVASAGMAIIHYMVDPPTPPGTVLAGDGTGTALPPVKTNDPSGGTRYAGPETVSQEWPFRDRE